MKNKILKIIIIITGIVLIAGNIYSIIELKEREEIIDKLEEELDEKKDKIKKSKSSIEELEYKVEYFENLYGKYNFNEEENDNSDIQQKYSNIESLTYQELKQKIDNKESFILLVSQTSCSHCIDYKPKYNKVMKKNKLIGYEIDLLTLSKDDYSSLMDFINVSGTPTTLLFNAGEEIADARLIGSKSEEDLTDTLKEYKFIKE